MTLRSRYMLSDRINLHSAAQCSHHSRTTGSTWTHSSAQNDTVRNWHLRGILFISRQGSDIQRVSRGSVQFPPRKCLESVKISQSELAPYNFNCPNQWSSAWACEDNFGRYGKHLTGYVSRKNALFGDKCI
jgi:hypothetical protein